MLSFVELPESSSGLQQSHSLPPPACCLLAVSCATASVRAACVLSACCLSSISRADCVQQLTMNLRCRGICAYAGRPAPRVLLIPRCNHLLACPPVSCGGSASTNERVFILTSSWRSCTRKPYKCEQAVWASSQVAGMILEHRS